MGTVRASGRWGQSAAAIVFAAWAVACLAGLLLLWRYKTRPGPDGEPPDRWPIASALHRTEGRPTLVMLVHPRCACSRASLDELAQVMSDARGVDAYVVFDVPPDGDSAWEHASTWDKARRIPGVVVVADRGGVESARFRVEVSGHTLLYDAQGALRFSGGITGARGHAGDNVGRQQLVAALRDRATGLPVTRVFGCRLFDPGRESL